MPQDLSAPTVVKGTVWPEGSDKDLAERFFGAMKKKRAPLMGTRRHWCELISPTG